MQFQTCFFRFNTYNINLKSKPSWFLDLSPPGKVPVVQVGDHFIGESLIASEFVEEKFPEPRLVADTPEQRAKDKLVYQATDKVGLGKRCHALYANLFTGIAGHWLLLPCHAGPGQG